LGRLIDTLKLQCEKCLKSSIPLSISGKYISGERAVIHQCPVCGYIRFHGQLGIIGERKQRRSKVTVKGGGRLTHYLRDMAKKLSHSF